MTAQCSHITLQSPLPPHPPPPLGAGSPGPAGGEPRPCRPARAPAGETPPRPAAHPFLYPAPLRWASAHLSRPAKHPAPAGPSSFSCPRVNHQTTPRPKNLCYPPPPPLPSRPRGPERTRALGSACRHEPPHQPAEPTAPTTHALARALPACPRPPEYPPEEGTRALAGAVSFRFITPPAAHSLYPLLFSAPPAPRRLTLRVNH